MPAAHNKPGNTPVSRVTAMRDTAGQDVASTPESRRPWGWIILGVASVAIVVYAWPTLRQWSRSELSVPIERLRIAEVTRQNFERDVAVRGTVVAAVSPTLYAPADGMARLHVQAGDRVNVGDALVTIDSPQLRNLYELEVATLQGMDTAIERQRIDKRKQELRDRQTFDQARVAVVAAERELRRSEIGWEAQVISRQDFDKARDDLASAQVDFKHAGDNAKLESESLEFELRASQQARDRQQLQVAELQRQLSELEITAPVFGVVGTLAISERQAVTTNTPLLTVVDLTAYEIEMTVPESYADDLAIGQLAFIEVGRSQYNGSVSSVSPEVQEGQVRGRIRFVDQVPDGLRQNQRVSVRVQLESRPSALTVRRGPFYDDGGGRIAYVIDGDVATKRMISTGAVSIDQIEILDGLVAGDRVVISSFEQFKGADTVLLSQ